jgi:DNA-directed RNA polymerase subunit M/transcription elongation factor TFIIS
MSRLLDSDNCPKCGGQMKRETTPAGTLFVCAKCGTDDPVKAAEEWIKGELRPPE